MLQTPYSRLQYLILNNHTIYTTTSSPLPPPPPPPPPPPTPPLPQLGLERKASWDEQFTRKKKTLDKLNKQTCLAISSPFL